MRFAVVGLGRFGFFWADLIKNIAPTMAYNRSQDKPTPEGVERVSKERLIEADIIFLCVAISSMETVLRALAPSFRKDAVVVDTCSVKTYPVQIMKQFLPSQVGIIASHPMFGPDSARNGVKGLPMVLHSIRGKQSDYEFLRKSFSDLGIRILDLSPEKHDRLGAYTQGITHFIGRVLSKLELSKEEMGTAGYNALLEIIQQTCNDPFQLFLDLQNYNPYTPEMRKKLHNAFLETEGVLGPSLDRPNHQS